MRKKISDSRVPLLPLGPRAVGRLRGDPRDLRPFNAWNVCCEMAGGLAVMTAIFALVYLGMWAAGDGEVKSEKVKVKREGRP